MLRVVASSREGMAWFEILPDEPQTAFIDPPNHFALRVYAVISSKTVAICFKQKATWFRSVGESVLFLNDKPHIAKGPNELATLVTIALRHTETRKLWTNKIHAPWDVLEDIVSAPDLRVFIE